MSTANLVKLARTDASMMTDSPELLGTVLSLFRIDGRTAVVAQQGEAPGSRALSMRVSHRDACMTEVRC